MVKRLPDGGYDRWVGQAEPQSGNRSPVFGNYESIKAGDVHSKTAKVKTLWESFNNSCQVYSSKNFLGYRPDDKSGYTWYTYAQVYADVEAIGSALASIGVKKGDKVGIYGANSPEWMMAMQACNRMGYACVPVYDTLGPNSVNYVLTHSEAKAVFVTAKKVGQLASALGSTNVTTVIAWGDADAADLAAIPSSIKSVSFKDFAETGRANMVSADPPTEDDLSTIMYTSGTTGNPKGVMLTHKALMHTVLSVIHMSVQAGDIVWKDDVLISYLPLAHIFQRVCEEMMIYCGCSIGYWRGDILGLLDDISHLKPTFFPGVPRVFDRIYSRVMDKIQGSFVGRLLYGWLFNRKRGFLRDGAHPFHASPLADAILFKKIKAQLGGRVRVVVSGGAPIAPHTEEFVRVAFGAIFIQGYGLTETCAATFLNSDSWDGFYQTVGYVAPGMEFCLESLPEMGYDATQQPPRGELLVRGPSVFSGYYKDKEKTAEAFSGEWFRTGDVAELQPNGAIRIVDRAKNLFKLAQGEYVSPEHIESLLKKNTNFDQICVHGESTETFVVAIVVPSKAAIEKWAKANGVEGSFEELCSKDEAKKWALEELTATSKEAKLSGFEMIKKVFLTPEAFSPDNDLLTPSFKLRRPQIKKKYLDAIKAMYGK